MKGPWTLEIPQAEKLLSCRFGPLSWQSGRRAWGQEPTGRARAWKVSHGARPRPRQGTAMASDPCVLPALRRSVYNSYPSLLGV